MTYDQTGEALKLLKERNEMINSCGETGPEYSFEAIGRKVGHTGEAIRLLSMRDMSLSAIEQRLDAKLYSKSILNHYDELIGMGWIVCHDLLRLDTSRAAYKEYLGYQSNQFT